MAQSMEDVPTEEVGKIVFSFMTDEEVKKHSVVKITNPIAVNTLGHPTDSGLYDPRLGSLDFSPCKLCGEGPEVCPGHCGHIDLAFPVYNPLLFDKLYSLLQQTCFFCYHFRVNREEVNKCVSRLELIAKGDVIGARNLDAVNSSDAQLISPEDSEGSNVSHLTESGGAEDQLDHTKQTSWDCFQYTEAMSVLSKFLRCKPTKCSNCSAKNPKITKPTFGWFESHLSSADIRGNIIKSHKLVGTEERSSSEVINASEENDFEAADNDSLTTKSGRKKSRKASMLSNQDSVSQEFEKNKNTFSGHLLPTEVKDVLKQLWENESPICSFICDLMSEQQNSTSRVTGHLMFFLESILVPPPRFRAQSKGGGDKVMDHPHTVLLGKIMESNIALSNAHGNAVQGDKFVDRWKDLQHSINILYNNSKDSKPVPGQKKVSADGIQQFIEKKMGIFRQKMMGKRVNFACRSVISPDPYLAVNEIGIPPYFAKKLTYPEKVTPRNVDKLRKAILNGPDVHPGAISSTEKGRFKKLQNTRKDRLATSKLLSSSRGAGTQLGKTSEYEFESKVVLRHLQDGDIVLVNRQPTLHKPSIMAHVVRVLKGEKTLRMHYANCSSYNADFDGDEMNVHFPQDEISRAEAYNIVNANEQYIVPTKGDTVRGLIQDHIVSAVLLTMKDTFLTHEEYNQLLYGALGSAASRISQMDSEFIQPVLPALWKPKPLWTGKQVITSLLNHLTRGCAPCTIEKEMKIPKQYFPSETFQHPGDKNGQDKSDNCFFVLKNEHVCGVIDKAQFGQFGLVHTVQELYGSNTAGLLLSSLSRLFTLFLQTHGFTCGVEDLMILPRYDVQRKAELEGEDVGEEVHCDFVNFRGGEIGPSELQLEVEKALSGDRESATALLDMKMKNKLTTKASQISKELLLKGLLKPFPQNCISLMTISGAKGSTVNFQQISSYLGQQELEGKRVPRMVSGKTLPCFPPWDFTSRAGGFITDRFLSGLRPQEYYFHCMAGREGLVDTAVKTSRSGYLQRCLIKNLENLKVCYDYTVRDADGSIVQFYYGEDGVDVHRTSFLKNLKALQMNEETLRDVYRCEPDFDSYIVELPVGLKERAESFLKTRHTNGQTFLKLLTQKYMSSLAPPGEPVGVIAAQSVGEPSTQMTLNTFHLAGRGEMNVTLGIPRLKEILNSASENISTPVLTCPFLQLKSKDEANLLVRKVMKITVADMIESMEVHLLPLSVYNNEMGRVYKILMTFKHHELVSQEDYEETLKHSFLRGLEDAIENHMALQSRISGIKNYKQVSSSRGEEKEDEMEMDEDTPSTSHGKESGADEDADSEDDGNDDDAIKKSDEIEYDDASEDESANEPYDEIGAGEKEDIMNEEPASEGARDYVEMSKPKSKDKLDKSASKKKKKSKKIFSGKETDRNIFVEVRGQEFEAHFRFTDEPHVLLAQIALKAAKSVYIKSSGKINHCKLVEHDVSENTVIWDKEKVDKQAKLKKERADQTEDLPPYCALKAAGIDFTAFWELQDDLDVNRIYSNSIHAMLTTYGVEAARETIIREVKNVFRIYGVEIDFRHLSLIADFMTKAGDYRAMSRSGCIKDTLSPLAKMSFETASKFLQEAASFGIADDLETPSARICLGLPVKVGTGSFDVMQKFEICEDVPEDTKLELLGKLNL